MYKCVGKKKLNYLQKEGVRKKKEEKKEHETQPGRI
jgi:hypothetical protein